jgi:2,3-bisphosphoglycerate-independent phosphoglycerate mutase
MARAHGVLADSTVNPTGATDIWLWGQGRRPSLPRFRDLWGVDGAAVAAAGLIRGIGVLAGLETPQVPGATAFLDTDYAAKGRAALSALERLRFVYVHVEAPDEAGHMGDAGEKVKAIAAVDREIVGPLTASRHLEGLLVLSDHPTPVRVRTHIVDPVPFVMWKPAARGEGPGSGLAGFGETQARAGGLRVASGPELMALFVGREPSTR